MKSYLKGWLYIFIAIALLYFATSSAHAQWPQGKGQAYLKLGTWNQNSDTHFSDTGDVEPNGLRTINVNSLFARVGIDDKWTITGNFPLINTSQSLESVRGVFTERGINVGDINLSLERLLYKSEKGLHIGADITLGLPVGAVGVVGSGDGEFNQMIRVMAGTGYAIGDEVVGKQYFYAKGGIGINNRTQGFSDEFVAGLETGTTIKDKLFVLTRLNVIKSFNNEPVQFFTNNHAVFGDRLERTTLGFEGTYNLSDNLGLSAGYVKPLTGKFVFNAPAWTAGIIYKIK